MKAIVLNLDIVETHPFLSLVLLPIPQVPGGKKQEVQVPQGPTSQSTGLVENWISNRTLTSMSNATCR